MSTKEPSQPAEAKAAPAPAMPNGVEELAYAQRLAVAIWSRNYRKVSPRWEVCGDMMGVLSQIDNMVSGMSAADNRGAAGVCCRTVPCRRPGVGPCDMPAKPTPAAVPAGEAVAWRTKHRDVDWSFTTRPHPKDIAAGIWEPLYTTPPAPVQAAPQEVEALARKFHDTYERLAPSFGYETRQETRQFDPETPNGRLMIAVCAELAAHHSACELGAVREALDHAEGRLAHYSLLNPRDTELSCAILPMVRRAKVALQHRGDSRGGEDWS